MNPLWNVLSTLSEFMETGGTVLLWILLVTIVMWTLILERLLYFRRVHPKLAAEVQERWSQREDQTSWYARRIRDQWISEAQVRLRHSIPMIQTLVALCPLLGLLGTVTGMMEVFGIMSSSGSGNARAMASGISKATIPTMAGMVAALSGLYFSISMDRFVEGETERIADNLVHH